MTRLMSTKRQLEDAILRTGHFKLLSPRGSGVPLVAVTLRRQSASDPEAPRRLYDEFAISDRLRQHGWTVPAYRMAPRAQHILLLRMVVREDLSPDMCAALGRHISEAVAYLDAQSAHMKEEDAQCVAGWHRLLRMRVTVLTLRPVVSSPAGASTSITPRNFRRTACATASSTRRCGRGAEGERADGLTEAVSRNAVEPAHSD